jgi:hypothetical protein
VKASRPWRYPWYTRMLDQLVLKTAEIKFQLKSWLFVKFGGEKELHRRECAMRNYLADQHAQAVRRERKQLQDLIRPLIRCRVERAFPVFNMSYTVQIDDCLLYESRNDRQAMIGYLAEQIASVLMNTQPVYRR